VRTKLEDDGLIHIDLTGPAGNAYSLMGTAEQIAKSEGWDEQQIEALMENMKSGDYEHLVSVLDDTFGELVVLYE